jgi:hypothetical protein
LSCSIPCDMFFLAHSLVPKLNISLDYQLQKIKEKM